MNIGQARHTEDYARELDAKKLNLIRLADGTTPDENAGNIGDIAMTATQAWIKLTLTLWKEFDFV